MTHMKCLREKRATENLFPVRLHSLNQFRTLTFNAHTSSCVTLVHKHCGSMPIHFHLTHNPHLHRPSTVSQWQGNSTPTNKSLSGTSFFQRFAMTSFFLNHTQDYSQHLAAATSFLAVMRFDTSKSKFILLTILSKHPFHAFRCDISLPTSPTPLKLQHNSTLITWIPPGPTLVTTTLMFSHIRLTTKTINQKSYHQTTSP